MIYIDRSCIMIMIYLIRILIKVKQNANCLYIKSYQEKKEKKTSAQCCSLLNEKEQKKQKGKEKQRNKDIRIRCSKLLHSLTIMRVCILPFQVCHLSEPFMY